MTRVRIVQSFLNSDENMHADACSDQWQELCGELALYLSDDARGFVASAYEFAKKAHCGQKRKSGEPFLIHPICVARHIAELRLDKVSVASALLHDVVEDTSVTIETISQNFGRQVAEIVEGLSKLEELKFARKEHQQALNFQKFILSTTKDLRVILVKLCDRLHNMRTLHHLPRRKQLAISENTLDIYAPIALRIGMGDLGADLQELSFKIMYPWRWRILQKAMDTKNSKSQKLLFQALKSLKVFLQEKSSIEFQLLHRAKKLYQIFCKMRAKKLNFNDILDIYAIRILVDSPDDCYRMLGLLHNFLPPVPQTFKDYIAIPKNNCYQSLHTVLMGPNNTQIEAQIRTYAMDEAAECGIAAHSLYKMKGGHNFDGMIRTRQWLENLHFCENSVGDTLEFMRGLRSEMLSNEVCVFTPKGDIKALPVKSTALDFAFALHTQIGLRATSCKINGHTRPVNWRIASGQTVEIIFRDDSEELSPQMLAFVVTSKARLAIRHQLKTIPKERAIQFGLDLIHNDAQERGITVEEIDNDEYYTELARKLNLPDRDALLYEIGIGNLDPALIAARLFDVPSGGKLSPITIKSSRTAIQGNMNLAIQYAKCCRPVRDDAIIGIPSADKGLVVHRINCRNSYTRAKKKNHFIAVEWSKTPAPQEEFIAAIRTVTSHRRGVLAVISSTIANMGANIEHIELSRGGRNQAVMTFLVCVKNRSHLQHICRKITKKNADTTVERIGLRHKC